MPVQLNHTIVHVRNSDDSAAFLAGVLGLAPPGHFGHFRTVEVANGVSLDFATTDSPITPQHYAFLVTETEFDEIFSRMSDRGLEHWADPGRSRSGQINHRDGGRGTYFLDPDGHVLEILTRPYGSGG